MAYFIQSKGKRKYILEEKGNAFVVTAVCMDNTGSDKEFKVNDTLSVEEFEDTTLKHICYVNLVSEFDLPKKGVNVQFYSTERGTYQVVANGIIRHEHLSSDEALRACSHYVKAEVG